MDVHEYQAKELLAHFGVPVPKGAVAFSPDQAVYAATELGGWNWAVKAQIHAGARGKAGGIKLCKTYHEVRDAAVAVEADPPEARPLPDDLCELCGRLDILALCADNDVAGMPRESLKHAFIIKTLSIHCH